MITVLSILCYCIIYRPGACILLKEYIICLFVCVVADSKYTDNSKPVFF